MIPNSSSGGDEMTRIFRGIGLIAGAVLALGLFAWSISIAAIPQIMAVAAAVGVAAYLIVPTDLEADSFWDRSRAGPGLWSHRAPRRRSHQPASL